MNKTVLITGASSGIGKSTARLFAAKGWNVVATMRAPEKETELAQSDNVLVTKLDVQIPASITAAVEAGIAKFGKIDVLVNNAGYAAVGVFEAASREQIKRQFDVNLFGLMDVTQAVLPHFRENGAGTIVNISSMGGRVTFPLGSLYNATKFAVEGFSEALAYELSTLNVAVKIVEPGSIDTNFAKTSAEFIANTIPAYDQLVKELFVRYRKPTEHLQKASAEQVGRVIYQAATDGTRRLRYVIGADAEMYIQHRETKSDAEYVKTMRGFFVD